MPAWRRWRPWCAARIRGRWPSAVPDALGALGAGHLHLSCACGREECTAVVDDGRATSVTIHVLADAEAVSAPVDPQIHGEKPPAEPIGFAEAIHEYHESTAARRLVPSAATAEAATLNRSNRRSRRTPDARSGGTRPATSRRRSSRRTTGRSDRPRRHHRPPEAARRGVTERPSGQPRRWPPGSAIAT